MMSGAKNLEFLAEQIEIVERWRGGQVVWPSSRSAAKTLASVFQSSVFKLSLMS